MGLRSRQLARVLCKARSSTPHVWLRFVGVEKVAIFLQLKRKLASGQRIRKHGRSTFDERFSILLRRRGIDTQKIQTLATEQHRICCPKRIQFEWSLVLFAALLPFDFYSEFLCRVGIRRPATKAYRLILSFRSLLRVCREIPSTLRCRDSSLHLKQNYSRRL